jgi:hypothetical protein
MSAVTAILHIIIISDNIFFRSVAQKLKLALEGIAFDNEKKIVYFICLIFIQRIGKEYYK